MPRSWCRFELHNTWGWKCNSLQLFSAQSIQMLMWSCGIALFYILLNMSSFSPISVCICLCLHLCITVIYLSISLEVTGSLFLFVLLAFNFSLDLSFLLKPLNFPSLFPISWVILSTLSSLSTCRKIHCLISDKQCDHSQLRNLLHFNFLPCKIEWVPLLSPSLRFFEREWVG